MRVALTILAMAFLIPPQAAAGGTPSYVFTAAPKYAPEADSQGRERFPAGSAITLVSGSARRKLAPLLYASADPMVSFDGARILFSGKTAATAPWQIYEAETAGGAPRLIVHCQSDCTHPLYLPDGRIVYTQSSDLMAIERAGAAPQRLTFAPGRHIAQDVLRDGRILFQSEGDLFTVYPDGTGVETLRCDHGPARAEARQVASGDVVFTVARRLARFTPALAAQAEIAQPDGEPAGPVAEISPGRWLISLRRPDGFFGLYLWSGAGGRAEPVELPGGLNAIQPAIVRRREPPKQFPSALVETRRTGNLLCLDAHASRKPITEAIQTVRIYTRDAAGAPVLLGKQEVAVDGSFYVEVPADKPLRIELLNAAGATVRAERGWFWMRPSEQRVCVGCHTGPERSPENRAPEVLLRSVIPEKLLGTIQ